MNAIIDALNLTSEMWWQYALHAMWQAAVLAVLIILVVRLGRRWPSPLRYWLLAIALIKFVIPPMLSVPVGVFTHAGPEMNFEQTTVITESEIEKPISDVKEEASITVVKEHPVEAVETTAPVEPVYELTDPAVETPGPVLVTETKPESKEKTPLIVSSASTLRWKTWLMFGHLAGIAVFAIWVMLQLMTLRRTIRNAREIVSGPLYERFAELVKKMSFNRAPRLLVTSEKITPMAFGLLRPAVVIPEVSPSDIDKSGLISILAHELAHIRRRDIPVNWLQIIITALWWFNPFLWLLNRELRRVREECCDDIVLSHGESCDDEYCTTLLNAASTLAVHKNVGARLGFADRLHPLGGRIKRIMDTTIRRIPSLPAWGALIIIILAVLFLPGLGCQKATDETDKAETSELTQPGELPLDDGSTAEPGSRPELNQYLLASAKEGNLTGVKSLIRRGAFINALDEEENTPLNLALAFRKRNVAEYLLDAGAEVRKGNKAGNWPLHAASIKGFDDLAVRIIEAGADVNARNASKERALQLAIGGGCKKAARLMIERGADVNAATSYGKTSLIKAALAADANMVSLLLEKGADVERSDRLGWRAIHFAAQEGDSAVLEILIAKGADIRAKTNNRASPLTLAASRGHEEVVKTLIKAYKNKDEFKEDAGAALSATVLGDSREVVDMLLDAGADINWATKNGDTALTEAVRFAKQDMVKFLLEHGASVKLPGTGNRRLVPRALEIENMEILKQLLDAGADPNTQGTSDKIPLNEAVKKGDKEAVKLLLDAGASLEMASEGAFGLMKEACKSGDLDMARLLLKAGATVKESGKYGLTLLGEAAAYGWTDALKFLIENGADVNKHGFQGQTALHAAGRTGQDAAAEILLKAGADIEARTPQDYTPLISAVSKGKRSTAALLIKAGANVNAQNKYQSSPLHYAATKGDKPMVKLLLDAGADPSLKEGSGKTPLDLARKRKDPSLVKLLEEHAKEEPDGGESKNNVGGKSAGRAMPPMSSNTKAVVKRGWGPEQATGEPDTPNAGDFQTAWASLSQDGQDEWLILEYEKAMKPTMVKVYETYNPGALCKVTLFDAEGKEVAVWEGKDPTLVGSGKGVSEIKVDTAIETKKIKLYLKSKEVKGWNEIDAVGLIDKDGNVQWAISAKASSTYGVTSIPDDDSKDYTPQAATPEGLYVEGRNLSREGRWKSAVKTWQTLIDKFPDHGRAGCSAIYMGQLQLSKKDFEGAEKSLKRAAEKLGHHKFGNGVEVGGYGYFYLVQLYCDTEQYEKAGETLKALVENYPYATGHRMGDALMSLRAKRWFYEKLNKRGVDLKFLDDLIAEQKDPKNFDRLNSRQLYLIAHILKDEDETKKAIEAFRKVMWKFPKESFTPYAAMFAFDLQLDAKDHEGAEETAQAMIKSFAEAKLSKGGPLAAIGYYNLGVVHFEKKEYKEAAEMFQKAAQDYPAATDRNGVSLKSLVTQHYQKTLKEKGFDVQGVQD